MVIQLANTPRPILPLYTNSIVALLCGAYNIPAPVAVGPKPPHTFNNPEWDAAIVETHLKNRANPITGISSKYSKHYKGD